MHEMGLVRNVVDMVLEECASRDVEAVTSVHLTIGEFGDVVESYVPELFRYLARGTVAADAEVVIERSPARVRCNRCGEIFRVDVHAGGWPCPRCGAQGDYRLFSGTEFRIDRIVIREHSESAA